jgi:hypothetical protein
MPNNKKNNAREVRKMRFNENKFNNLVHYICHQCEDTATLGATKLNKVLWFSDLYSYLMFGKPITGEKYVKRQHGPVPAHILRAIEKLEYDKKIVTRDSKYFGYNKRDYVSIKKPVLSEFNADEISLVGDMIDIICANHTACSISLTSHDKIWELAEIGEEIPYNTVFASHLGEINEEDIAWAQEQLEKKTPQKAA